MPAAALFGPKPKSAPAVIGSLGRCVGAVNGVNEPGRAVGVAGCCGADAGDCPIGTACCDFCCANAIPYCWLVAVVTGSFASAI